jgi:3',5'-cyclic AMP phosphodiesterase CpdA
MVTRKIMGFTPRAQTVILLMIPVLISLTSCPVYYDDYDSRFTYHNEFRFLSTSNGDFTPDLGEPYEFIVLSDTHISGSADDFAAIKDHVGSARFLVVTGDITDNGTGEEFERFKDAARAIRTTAGIPCYPVIGNHDIYTNRGTPWKEHIGSASYRINGGDTSLFILDNANGYFGNDQITWFERELNSVPGRVFVFAHENFFISSSPSSLFDAEQTTDVRERALFTSLLRGRCDIMFMGHLHKRIINKFAGVWFIMLEDFRSTKTFCRVRVSGENISWTFETIP